MDVNEVFRKEFLEHDDGSEQLTGYVRASSPVAWMALAAVAVLVAGLWVWGFWGVIERDVSTVAVVKDGQAVMYVPFQDAGDIKEGMTVRLGDNRDDDVDSAGIAGAVGFVGASYDTAPSADVPEILVQSNIGSGERYCQVTARLDVANGEYPVSIVTDTIRPISLLFG